MEDPSNAVRPLSDDDRKALLRLARRAVECHFEGLPMPEPSGASPALQRRQACFVTLRKRPSGELRGCRGECPARHALYVAVRRMAIAAAIDDPRFLPVTSAELVDLRFGINALTDLHPIDPAEVVVGRHGLLIISPRRAGLLLPEVPLSFGWDREAYLEGLCRKAGMPEEGWRDPETRLYGFESEAWWEADEEHVPARHRSRLRRHFDRFQEGAE